MQACIILLATVETKAAEIDFLVNALGRYDVTARVVDVSLGARGAVWDGTRKVAEMLAMADRTAAMLDGTLDDISAVVGIGGGTGGEIILNVMRKLPYAFPKMLVTTLPFDPRPALADNSIVIVPTLADISGLNTALRLVLGNTAAMAAGLCQEHRRVGRLAEAPSVGVTSLGATSAAVDPLIAALQAQGHETTVFHANGFGGAAFARFAEGSAFRAIVDLTTHELTRSLLDGAHVAMPRRFTAAPDLPRIVLPGGLNFLGLGPLAELPPRYEGRPHYAHSGFFTHVQLTTEEMAQVSAALAGHLAALTGPVTLILPMGGFSHQDAPGGAIESAALRQAFADTIRADLPAHVTCLTHEAHIADPRITRTILDILAPHL